MKIQLPAKPSDDLKWEKQRHQAEMAEKIVWEFDLGLEYPIFPLEEELQLQSLSLALETFARELYPAFAERTERAILYCGSSDFSASFFWTELQERNWEEWRRERWDVGEEHLKRLFCADAYAHYFQMLAHRLPDELPIALAFLEEGCGTRAEREQLFSRERFEHFQIERKGLVKDAPIAVCFPEEALCSREVLDKMDALFEQIKAPFRVIGEPFLTEEWGGVDFLFVLEKALSPRGKRMLMGFCAAGGTVVLDGNPLGLPQEMPLSEFSYSDSLSFSHSRRG